VEFMWVEWHSVYSVTNSFGTRRVSLFSEVATAIGRSCSSMRGALNLSRESEGKLPQGEPRL